MYTKVLDLCFQDLLFCYHVLGAQCNEKTFSKFEVFFKCILSVLISSLSIICSYPQGLFRISCEDILRILRRGRETLLTLLEAFVYDPLIDWTQSEDAAFPLAVRTSKKEQTGRQSRKEMEREVASGMLVTRLAESGPYWQRNRYAVNFGIRPNGLDDFS